MPYQQIAGTDCRYAMISFNATGAEQPENGGLFSQLMLAELQQQRYSHIFVFTHGWKGDLPAAIDQFDRWIGAMWRLEADRAAMGPDFRPLFVGLHWPSQPWGEEEAKSGPVSFDISDVELEPAKPDTTALFAEALKLFGDTPAVHTALRTIFDAYEADPYTMAVPADALAAYHDLAAAIGFSAGTGGPESAPDTEGAALDPQQAVLANRLAESGASFGIGGAAAKMILGGLRQLSFWTMKKRARAVGEGGMHELVSALLANSAASVHLMGHSFGCVVMSSVLGKGNLPRPVASCALVQGAVSLWSWGSKVKWLNKPGYFHNILVDGAVAGPVVTTRSVHDMPVGLAYPAAVALVADVSFAANADLPLFGGVGTYGLQGTDIAIDQPMLTATESCAFHPGRIYNLEASPFIGGHSDIDGPEVAHVLWTLAKGRPQ